MLIFKYHKVAMYLDLYIRTYIAEMLKHCSKQLHITIITSYTC